MQKHPHLPDLIQLAHFMADQSRDIIRRYFRQSFQAQTKPDHTPVTEADLAIETRLREILSDQRPDDGILGEEFEHIKSRSGLTWVIDPIDGTKSFTIGRPSFGTLIGLCEGETPVLGIIDQAITQERWIGVQGVQTSLNGKPVYVRDCPNLINARVGISVPDIIGLEAYRKIKSNCYSIHYNGDCYFYGLLACGFMDAVIEDDLKPFDFIALAPVVKGAGGIITDWDGKQVTLTSGPRILASGDEKAHHTLMSLLASK